jgi:myosin heavy chain 9/10/11/14
LETTRVIHQNENERNFHVFYQIFTDSEAVATYHLTKPQDYSYINQTGIYTVDGVNDEKEWKDTKKSMSIIGINEKEQEFVFGTIAAILHLGNVTFTAGSDGNAEIVDKQPMKEACKLLGVAGGILEKALAHPKISVNKEVIETHETPQRANFNKDALVKSIYRRLFNWLVQRVNQSLAAKESVKNTIGLLDIAGFEIFTLNSFEQLCINFTNEKLQQFFNNHMFKKEQEEYLREKIEWKFIDFGLDLQPTIDLIEKQGGVFAILDEQTTLGGTNDKVVVERLKKNFKEHEKFTLDKFDQMKFNVVHYAGEVSYDTDQWLHKNTDPLTNDSEKAMSASKKPLVSNLFPAKDSRKGGARFLSVAKEYKDQLESLMQVLRSTEPHFIRCIIPNHKMKAGYLEPEIVLSQLRCNGVLEGIRISRKGYPGRVLFNEFYQRYKVIANSDELDAQMTLAGKAKVILQATDLKQKDHYLIGMTKVFFKAGAEALIEKIRDKKIAEVILCGQAAIRGYLARKEYKRIISQIDACRLIQQNWRIYLDLKNWAWWKVLSIGRSLVDPDQSDKELDELKKKIEELKDQVAEENRDKKRVQKEKGDVLVDIERLKSDILSNQQKIENFREDLSKLTDRERELLNQLDALAREKKMLDDEARSNSMKFQEQDTIYREKEKTIDDLQSDLGSGGEEASKLKGLLEEVKKEKLKVESTSKQLDDEIKDQRNKLDAEILRSQEMERTKATLEEKLKEVSHKLQTNAKEKTTLESKYDESLKTLKDTDTQLKAALDQIKNLMGDESKKSSVISVLTSDLDELSRKIENAEREKRGLENQNRELEDKQSDAENKRSAADKLFKHAKEDLNEAIKTFEKLEEERVQNDENLSRTREETGEIRTKLIVLEDENIALTKKKTDFERDISGLKTDLQELKNRNEKTVETLQKKLSDTERDLKDQLAQELSNKESAESAFKSARDQSSDLKRQIDALTSERDSIDAKLKRLELTLNSEQGDLVDVKRNVGELQNAIRALTNKIKEVESKISSENEDKMRNEQKKNILNSQFNENRDYLDSLLKDKDEITSENQTLKSSNSKTKSEVEGLREESNQLKTKNSLQEGDIKSMKDRNDELAKAFNAAKVKNKDLEAKSNQANLDNESSRGENKILEGKIQKAEQQVSKLKSKLDEERSKTRKEQEEKSTSEQALREKKFALETVQKQIEDKKKKFKDSQSKVNELETIISDENSKASKLRAQITQLDSQRVDLAERLEEINKNLGSSQGGSKTNKDKITEAERTANEEIKLAQKLTLDNQKLKAEFDKVKMYGEENDKKYQRTQESLKMRMDQLEQDHDIVIRRLTDEKADLKRNLKLAQKNAKVSSTSEASFGTVPKEALDKAQKDFDIELEKLRVEIEQLRKDKLTVEASKRSLEFQLNSLRDQLDNEERQRKKVEVQKKTLQIELEDLRQQADEAEELKEELEDVRHEAQIFKKELHAEKEKEKIERDKAEDEVDRFRNQVDELKKQLADEQAQSATEIRSIRQKYEKEVSDYEDLISKSRKDKKNTERGTKKVDRSGREIARKLNNAEIDLQQVEEKVTMLTKDHAKIQNEYDSQSRKLASLEGNNGLLKKESEEWNERVKKLEKELADLKVDVAKQSSKSKKAKKASVDSDSE